MDEQTYNASITEILEASQTLRPEFEGRYYRWPFLSDDTSTTSFDPHYIYHVAWALRKLVEQKPSLHVDFSSSLHFCTAAAAICETRFYDIRPAELSLAGLTCLQADLTGLDIASGSLNSVSCMHVIEHIGLGRYGDALDPCGDLRAIDELKRVVAPGGLLYMVVPTGLPCIAFNAHRVYAAEHFVSYFADAFGLEDFYFIPAPGIFTPISNPPLAETRAWDYGCGCYLFRKKGAPSASPRGPFAALADRFRSSANARER